MSDPMSDSISDHRSSHSHDPSDGVVRVFDTTLRDGEQAPGCSMTPTEKLRVARQIALLGADIIEAGFPAASPGDAEAVRVIATEVGTADGPVICALARATPHDIDICAHALTPAVKRRIHTFIATSDVHMEHKLRMSRSEVIASTRLAVTHARALADDVEFSAEDASRSDPDFLCDVFAAAVECGATTVNVPDTVGYVTPAEYAALIARVVSAVRADGITVSTHCHNDLGLAVANTLAGITAGARQVECTINGLGERAGNAALAEVVMALHTRQGYYGISTDIRTRELMRSSQVVAEATGVHMPCNKPIVGANAFSHEAGIHQDGVLKHRATYEIMSAELVGATGDLILGKHSGRNAFRQHIHDHLGYTLDDDTLQRAFTRFKAAADERKVVTTLEIAQIIRELNPSTPYANA